MNIFRIRKNKTSKMRRNNVYRKVIKEFDERAVKREMVKLIYYKVKELYVQVKK